MKKLYFFNTMVFRILIFLTPFLFIRGCAVSYQTADEEDMEHFFKCRVNETQPENRITLITGWLDTDTLITGKSLTVDTTGNIIMINGHSEITPTYISSGEFGGEINKVKYNLLIKITKGTVTFNFLDILPYCNSDMYYGFDCSQIGPDSLNLHHFAHKIFKKIFAGFKNYKNKIIK